jgi:hypothetical protein
MERSGVVAIMLGAFALVALYAAARVNGRGEAGHRAATGYVVFGVAAAAEGWNLVTGYSTTVAVVAAVGLVAGLVMIARAWGARATTR